MKQRSHLLEIAATFLFLVPVSAQAAAPVFVTGSHRVAVEKGRRSVQAADAVKKAFAQLQSRLATRKVKAYIVSDNLSAPQAVAQTMQRLAGQTPWAGQANNWQSYLPVDRDSLAAATGKKEGVNITAICGDVDVQFEVVTGVKADKPAYDLPRDEWKKRWLAQKPLHVAKAKALAGKLTFPDGKDHLVLAMGTMHTPRNEYIYEGLASGLDETVILAGGSGADFATIYHKGQRLGDAILAVRISGQFRAATIREHGSENIPEKLPKLLAALNKQMGRTQPTALVYFGCAGWREQPEAQQRALTDAVDESVGVFGQFCGGEFGRFAAGKGFAGTDYAVLVLLGPRTDAR